MPKTFYLHGKGSANLIGNPTEYGTAPSGDYLNGKQFTYSIWLRPTQAQSTLIWGLPGPVGGINMTSSGESRFQAAGGVGTGVILNTAAQVPIVNNSWNHVMVSVDAAVDIVHYWINGQENTTYNERLVEDEVLPNFGKEAFFGWNGYSGAGFIGDVSEFWFDDSFMDLSIQANRDKFLTGSGKPAELGSTGQLPTGSTPRMYLTGNLRDWNNGQDLGTTPDYPTATPYGRPSDTKVMLP